MAENLEKVTMLANTLLELAIIDLELTYQLKYALLGGRKLKTPIEEIKKEVDLELMVRPDSQPIQLELKNVGHPDTKSNLNASHSVLKTAAYKLANNPNFRMTFTTKVGASSYRLHVRVSIFRKFQTAPRFKKKV